MPIRVYQFGLLPPIDGEARVRVLMRQCHEYRNELVAIERGRRAALRALHDTQEVADAVALVKASKGKPLREAIGKLYKARRAAEKAASHCPGVAEASVPEDASDAERSRLRRVNLEARAAAGDAVARITLLDESIRRDARALSPLSPGAWANYQTIEAAATQVRAMPLYERDAVTPSDPRFVKGPRAGQAFPVSNPKSCWWLGDQQVSMHIQGRTVTTADVLAGKDAWVRLELEPARLHGGTNGGKQQYSQYGVLKLRVANDTRCAVWASWPIKLHRAIPNAAKWQWVRVSCRRLARREVWTVEITLNDPQKIQPRPDVSGAVAVELLWTPLDDGSMRVASWRDSFGATGELLMSSRMVGAIRKADGIRSVRDTLLNALRPALAEKIQHSADKLPTWLREVGNVLHLWKSQDRFYELALRWRKDKVDAARDAYELLQEWELRDAHLLDYEAGSRRNGIGWRNHYYSNWAAGLARRYKAVIVPDRDLSLEARFGDDSDRRTTVSPQKLRDMLLNAFGEDAVKAVWKGPHGVPEDSDDTWLEVVSEQWRNEENTGGACAAEKDNAVADVGGSAWAKRKARARERAAGKDGARKDVGNTAE